MTASPQVAAMPAPAYNGPAYLAARLGDSIGGHGSWITDVAIAVGVGLLAAAVVVGAALAAPVVLAGAALAITVALAVGTGATVTAMTAKMLKRHKHAKKSGPGHGELHPHVDGISCSTVAGPCSDNVYIEGEKAARAEVDVGGHGWPGIAQGSRTVLVNGRPLARENDGVRCGARITHGSERTWIGGPPSAEIDDDASDGPLDWLITWGTRIGAVGFLAAFAIPLAPIALEAGIGAAIVYAAGITVIHGETFVMMPLVHDWVAEGFGDDVADIADIVGTTIGGAWGAHTNSLHFGREPTAPTKLAPSPGPAPDEFVYADGVGRVTGSTEMVNDPATGQNVLQLNVTSAEGAATPAFNENFANGAVGTAQKLGANKLRVVLPNGKSVELDVPPAASTDAAPPTASPPKLLDAPAEAEAAPAEPAPHAPAGKTMGDVERIGGQRDTDVTSRDQLSSLVEEPALPAAQTLYDRNIQTIDANAHAQGDATDAALLINYDTLSPENQAIASRLGTVGQHPDGGRAVELTAPFTKDTPVAEVQENLGAQAQQFLPQRADWAGRTDAQLARLYATEPGAVPPAEWESAGWYYDKVTERYYRSPELRDKAALAARPEGPKQGCPTCQPLYHGTTTEILPAGARTLVPGGDGKAPIYNSDDAKYVWASSDPNDAMYWARQKAMQAGGVPIVVQVDPAPFQPAIPILGDDAILPTDYISAAPAPLVATSTPPRAVTVFDDGRFTPDDARIMKGLSPDSKVQLQDRATGNYLNTTVGEAPQTMGRGEYRVLSAQSTPGEVDWPENAGTIRTPFDRSPDTVRDVEVTYDSGVQARAHVNRDGMLEVLNDPNIERVSLDTDYSTYTRNLPDVSEVPSEQRVPEYRDVLRQKAIADNEANKLAKRQAEQSYRDNYDGPVVAGKEPPPDLLDPNASYPTVAEQLKQGGAVKLYRGVRVPKGHAITDAAPDGTYSPDGIYYHNQYGNEQFASTDPRQAMSYGKDPEGDHPGGEAPDDDAVLVEFAASRYDVTPYALDPRVATVRSDVPLTKLPGFREVARVPVERVETCPTCRIVPPPTALPSVPDAIATGSVFNDVAAGSTAPKPAVSTKPACPLAVEGVTERDAIFALDSALRERESFLKLSRDVARRDLLRSRNTRTPEEERELLRLQAETGSLRRSDVDDLIENDQAVEREKEVLAAVRARDALARGGNDLQPSDLPGSSPPPPERASSDTPWIQTKRDMVEHVEAHRERIWLVAEKLVEQNPGAYGDVDMSELRDASFTHDAMKTTGNRQLLRNYGFNRTVAGHLTESWGLPLSTPDGIDPVRGQVLHQMNQGDMALAGRYSPKTIEIVNLADKIDKGMDPVTATQELGRPATRASVYLNNPKNPAYDTALARRARRVEAVYDELIPHELSSTGYREARRSGTTTTPLPEASCPTCTTSTPPPAPAPLEGPRMPLEPYNEANLKARLANAHGVEEFEALTAEIKGYRAPVTRQLLANGAQQLSELSPTFHATYEKAVAAGWQMQPVTAGEGTVTLQTEKLVKVDAGDIRYGRGANALAHELGHVDAAMVEPEQAIIIDENLRGPDGEPLPKDPFVDNMVRYHMRDEGKAVMFNAKVRNEVLGNGGPDIGGVDPAEEAIIDEYNGGSIGQGQALDQLGTIRESKIPSDMPDKTYAQKTRDYYSQMYDALVHKP